MADLRTIKDARIGDTIVFTSHHPSDFNEYKGEIIGFGNYDTVKNLTDVVPYYQKVLTKLPNLDHFTKLIYFIIQYQQDGKTTKGVFANDYVETIHFIDTNSQYDIRVYDTDISGINSAVNLLRSSGYRCKLM